MKLVLLALLLTGCAYLPGVEATPEERAACKAETCSVWTINELTRLGRKFFNEGYQAGKASI